MQSLLFATAIPPGLWNPPSHRDAKHPRRWKWVGGASKAPAPPSLQGGGIPCPSPPPPRTSLCRAPARPGVATGEAGHLARSRRCDRSGRRLGERPARLRARLPPSFPASLPPPLRPARLQPWSPRRCSGCLGCCCCCWAAPGPAWASTGPTTTGRRCWAARCGGGSRDTRAHPPLLGRGGASACPAGRGKRRGAQGAGGGGGRKGGPREGVEEGFFLPPHMKPPLNQLNLHLGWVGVAKSHCILGLGGPLSSTGLLVVFLQGGEHTQ